MLANVTGVTILRGRGVTERPAIKVENAFYPSSVAGKTLLSYLFLAVPVEGSPEINPNDCGPPKLTSLTKGKAELNLFMNDWVWPPVTKLTAGLTC